MEKKPLTPLELKVMNLLWQKGEAYVKDLVEEWPDTPCPAYNTVSTVVRILEEKKGFISHKAKGRSHLYYPTVSRGKYQQFALKNMIDTVFSGSMTGMVSTLLSHDKVSQDQVDALKEMINQSEADQ